MDKLLDASSIAVGTLGAAAAFFRYAATSPRSQLFGQTLIGGRNPREVSLTYDDGPNGDLTLRLLDVLAERKTPATFFCIGKFVQQQPQIVRRVLEAGHIVGNHTMTHPILSWQSTARIREELTGCNAALEDATGQQVKYFRPPHGARRPAVLRVCRELGLTPVLWNCAGYDWNPIAASEIVSNIAQDIQANRGRGRGSNVLLHDGSHLGLGHARANTVEATARLIDKMSTQEMHFVGLDGWRAQVFAQGANVWSQAAMQ